MAKKVSSIVKIQIPAGKATPAPPIGSVLGPKGINIAGFVKEFNDRTASQAGFIIPCVITIYEDRSFTFVLKTPPAPVLIRKEAGIEKGTRMSVSFPEVSGITSTLEAATTSPPNSRYSSRFSAATT